MFTVPKLTSSSFKHVTSLLFFAIAMYSAVYGVTYAYLLHHLANLLATWLLGIYLVVNGFSFGRLWRIIVDGDELPSDSGSRHIKKKP